MPDLSQLTDEDLVAAVRRLAQEERRNVVALLRHINLMDLRELAQKQAYPSLFEYCVNELRWAEGETAKRIHVARAAARLPRLFGALRRGLLTLSSAALLAPHLSRREGRALIRKAYGRSTRDVEAMVAAIAPQPRPKERIRFLGLTVPATASGDDEVLGTPAEPVLPCQEPMPDAPPSPPPPQRVLFSFTADERLLAQVERAKELLRGNTARRTLRRSSSKPWESC